MIAYLVPAKKELLKPKTRTEKFVEFIEKDIAKMYNHHSDIYGRDLIVTLIPDQYETGYGTMIASVNGSPTRGQAIIRCGATKGQDGIELYHYVTYASEKVSKVKHFEIETKPMGNFSISLEELKKNKRIKFCETNFVK